MDKIESLLVIVDPTVERDFALKKAKLIAKLSKAKVHFFINNANTLHKDSYIYEGIDADFFDTQKKLFRDHFEKQLHDHVDEFANADIEASYSFEENHHLAEAIISKAKELKPDLVIKSTHHHSAINRSLLSNTDWRLIRKCPATLLLVKPELWQPEGSIVAAVDPLHFKTEQSDLDSKIVETTAFLCKEFNLSPGIFHSYYPFVSTLFPMGGETKEHLDRIRQQHLDKVSELTNSVGIKQENIHVTEGDLIQSLVEYLEEVRGNVLVVGALSKNILERAIIGNTAEKILENCPSDVMIVKS
ncbi:MAG: hypothetical protein GKR91_13090 [Pseudomonadales bacterium]|nr:hypothetical protein [Pseudomonadales bacterium]